MTATEYRTAVQRIALQQAQDDRQHDLALFCTRTPVCRTHQGLAALLRDVNPNSRFGDIFAKHARETA